MPAQNFKSIFTADISQYRSEMQVLKQSTSGVVGEIRNSFAAIAGLSLAGIGVKELVSDIIKLGAEMQQTRTSFEVMLGSADAAGKVIAELNNFADYTPFDNAEVIKSGRLLMNAGVATEELSAKLTTLGNIAAGAQVPLTDMVAIYAKAANKGKVQAEELNQMAERGVPVMQALAKTLGRTTQEILDMGSKGQLSFALLDEALASLSSEGGKYFGLMEKQSQNLAGRWSAVAAAIRNTGIAIGEEAIPALSAALEEFSSALDEMSQSGELDQIVRDTAKAIGEIANSLKDITLWMIKYQKEIKAIAGGALWIGVAMKSRAIIMSLATGLQHLGAEIGVAGTAAVAASGKVGILAASLKGVGMAAGVAGTVLATAFIGFKIGSILGELLKLDEVFTRLILKKQGLTDAEIDSATGGGVVTPSMPKYDLAKAEKEKAELEARLAKLSEISLPKETEAELS
ncbi:MAG: tape measure protein, partial [Bacilli bacterium]